MHNGQRLFTYSNKNVVFHDPHLSHRKQTVLDENVPDTFDWRQTSHLPPLPIHLDTTIDPPSALIMAVYTLQTRWALWHQTYVYPSLSVAYPYNLISKYTNMSTPLTVSLVDAWLTLQEHGTQDAELKAYRARGVYTLQQNIENIRRDIFVHGPVSAHLSVSTASVKAYLAKQQTACQNKQTLSITSAVFFPPEPAPDSDADLGADLGADKGVSVQIIGWGNYATVPYWIVATHLGYSTYASRQQYGNNGYFLVAANGHLERTCTAAFPFFNYYGVKQPTCCNHEFQEHLRLDVHGPIFATKCVTINWQTTQNPPVPLVLHNAKRPRHPPTYHPKTEIHLPGHASTTAHQENYTTTDPETWTKTPLATTGSSGGSDQAASAVPASNVTQQLKMYIRLYPGEFVVVLLIIIACILAFTKVWLHFVEDRRALTNKTRSVSFVPNCKR